MEVTFGLTLKVRTGFPVELATDSLTRGLTRESRETIEWGKLYGRTLLLVNNPVNRIFR